MEPDLDKLVKEEFDAFENLHQAFIRHSIARNAVKTRLQEVADKTPTLFTQEH